MSKKLEDMTYDELVDEMTRRAHSALLESGGKGLRNAIFMALQTAMTWNEKRDKK